MQCPFPHSQRGYSMASFLIPTPQIASSPVPPKKLEVSFTNNPWPDGSRTRNDTINLMILPLKGGEGRGESDSPLLIKTYECIALSEALH